MDSKTFRALQGVLYLDFLIDKYYLAYPVKLNTDNSGTDGSYSPKIDDLICPNFDGNLVQYATSF
jgi:hypothetical protein